jgi:uncharacterized protein YfiM (DUF2279 family)
MINMFKSLLTMMFIILLLEGHVIQAADFFQVVNDDTSCLFQYQALPKCHHDNWTSEDKAVHVIACFISTTLINQLAIRSGDFSSGGGRYLSAGFVFTLGAVKEINDNGKRNNFFSWKDLSANILGITLAVILSAGSE